MIAHAYVLVCFVFFCLSVCFLACLCVRVCACVIPFVCFWLFVCCNCTLLLPAALAAFWCCFIAFVLDLNIHEQTNAPTNEMDKPTQTNQPNKQTNKQTNQPTKLTERQRDGEIERRRHRGGGWGVR